jgi:hypothetical protein
MPQLTRQKPSPVDSACRPGKSERAPASCRSDLLFEFIRDLAVTRWGMPSSKKALLDAASKRADKLRAKGKEVGNDRSLCLSDDRAEC